MRDNLESLEWKAPKPLDEMTEKDWQEAHAAMNREAWPGPAVIHPDDWAKLVRALGNEGK
jgi:hypothetical protein